MRSFHTILLSFFLLLSFTTAAPIRKVPSPKQIDQPLAVPEIPGQVAIESVGITAALLSATDVARIKQMGFTAGLNPTAPNGHSWIGTQGPFKFNVVNKSKTPIIFVLWGPWASWVNDKQPMITLSLAPGAGTVISAISGVTGGFSAVYPDTKLVNGQVSNTWGEYTFGAYGTIDVSRLPNMNGHSLSMATPNCVSNMNTCVFLCPKGQTICKDNYSLFNCAIGSQVGANYGLHEGAPTGGCQGLGTAGTVQVTWA